MSELKERSVELNYFDIYPAPKFMNELLPQVVLLQCFDNIIGNRLNIRDIP